MTRLVAKKAVVFRSGLIVSVLALSLLFAPTAGVAKRDRSETQNYVGGGDAALICKDELGTPASVGGVCFKLDGRESVAFIDINDDSGQKVLGLYQFTDSSGAALGDDAFCDSIILQVPNNAVSLNIFLSTAIGLVNDVEFVNGTTCFSEENAGVVTAGEVTVSYELKGGPNRHLFDEERECLEPVPDSAGVAGVTDAGQTVNLAVRVLLDGVAPTVGAEVFSKAAESYAPLGIEMVASFESVSFIGNQASGLIYQAKEHFRGVRPTGTDIVYVLTDKNITALGLSGVAGLADCIGGVRFPERAFAVGEILEPIDLFVATAYLDGTAKVAAHEIGHLMGGHHHYANCAEGVSASDVENGEPHTLCTLMSNFADFVSGNFAVVNGSVVRGHAVNYASP